MLFSSKKAKRLASNCDFLQISAFKEAFIYI